MVNWVDCDKCELCVNYEWGWRLCGRCAPKYNGEIASGDKMIELKKLVEEAK